MTYTPSPNKKTALLITFLLLFLSLTCIFTAISVLPSLSNIFGPLALIFFLSAVIITTRYLVFRYTYSTDGTEFEIIQKSAHTHKRVCLIYCAEITAVLPLKEAKNKLKGLKIYDYRVSLLSKSAYCLFLDDGYESSVIFLECSSELAEYLKPNAYQTPYTELL